MSTPSVIGARQRVLAALRASHTPLEAAAVAAQLGLHITTARYHLQRLLQDGSITAAPLKAGTVGRPRMAYASTPDSPLDSLIGILSTQLGETPEIRLLRGVEVGAQWFAASAPPAPPTVDFPDPVLIAAAALQRLGFTISTTTSIFGVHEITVCGCPLQPVAAHSPKVAQGILQGIARAALEQGAPVTLPEYGIEAIPDPTHGTCGLTLRLTQSRGGHSQAAHRHPPAQPHGAQPVRGGPGPLPTSTSAPVQPPLNPGAVHPRAAPKPE